MATATNHKITETPSGDFDYSNHTFGLLRAMPRNAQSVWATFGMFERRDGYLYYSMDTSGMDLDECHSHYLDDVKMIKAGNVDVADRRTS